MRARAGPSSQSGASSSTATSRPPSATIGRINPSSATDASPAASTIGPSSAAASVSMAVARVGSSRPRHHDVADGGEQLLDRAERHPLGDARQPISRDQRLRTVDHAVERDRARLVIGYDIGEPRRESPAAAPREARSGPAIQRRSSIDSCPVSPAEKVVSAASWR